MKVPLPSDRTLLLISLAVHVGLIGYGHWIDTHPERYGGLKYTDVDWRVVTDGAKLIWEGKSPYDRQTFRYTPLLPLLLSPALIHPLLGKVVLSLLSLSLPLLLLCLPAADTGRKDRAPPRGLVHGFWTLNPLVINITTRGSPEAIVLLLVTGTVVALKGSESRVALNAGGSKTDRGGCASRGKWDAVAGLVYAGAISWKIYPVIYVPAIWSYLATTPTAAHSSQPGNWFGWRVWRFGLITAFALALINLPLWMVWGQPFLDGTFLYHLSRLDHRHNFSPYYYPIYLSFFTPSSAAAVSTPTSTSATTSTPIPSLVIMLQAIVRHPLASFIPQFGLVTLIGFYLTRRTSLEFSMFLQTVVFVAFNKVCTSQYFTWFIPFLPCIIPHLDLSTPRTIIILSAWVGAQALWLSTAYRLEFLAQSVHLQLWAAGVGLFGVSVWIIGELIESWDSRGSLPGPAGTVAGNVPRRGKRQ